MLLDIDDTERVRCVWDTFLRTMLTLYSFHLHQHDFSFLSLHFFVVAPNIPDLEIVLFCAKYSTLNNKRRLGENLPNENTADESSQEDDTVCCVYSL